MHEKKKNINKKLRFVANMQIFFAAIGFVLMIIENELTSLHNVYTKVNSL